MLKDFCNFLSDEAQLKIALRLGKHALPAWVDYFAAHPVKINEINDLILSENKVKGGANEIDANFPVRALEKIERSYKNAKRKEGLPVANMKSDGTLSPILATSIQPLTNKNWDNILPYSVRLVFTMVWNIVTWILYKRSTDVNETHIYVAINQAADVLMTEKLKTVPQIEKILAEYKHEARQTNEDELWEKAPKVKKGETLTQDEVYQKIIGENIVKDACGRELATEILRQMHEEGKTFWDEWEEYYSGTSKTYSYNKERKSYWLSEVDVIALSFANDIPMTEKEMLDFISGVSLHDLRGDGFEI